MSKLLLKNRLIYGGLLALFFSMICGVTFYHSSQATVSRLIKSVQEKDVDTFLSIVPTFSDGDKISKKQAKIFIESLNKNKYSQIKQIILNKELFYEKGKEAIFTPKKFLPQKRYLTIDWDGNQCFSFQIGNEVFNIDKKRVGPFIPSNYTIEMYTQSDVFGLSKEILKEKLFENDQVYEFNEELFYLFDNTFHEILLDNLVSLYSSMNQGISNNFDFSSILFSSKETTEERQAYFDEVKEYLTSYKQSFQNVVINIDSLKINHSTIYEVTFDCYIDLQIEAKFIDDNETFVDKTENAVVQMIFDEERMEWVVDTVDFETFVQDPTEWENKKSASLKEANIGVWTRDSSGFNL